jgi:hypothetical protein
LGKLSTSNFIRRFDASHGMRVMIVMTIGQPTLIGSRVALLVILIMEGMIVTSGKPTLIKGRVAPLAELMVISGKPTLIKGRVAPLAELMVIIGKPTPSVSRVAPMIVETVGCIGMIVVAAVTGP